MLEESGSGVTALDFELEFDAALFTPVSVEAGPAAEAAGKILEANLAQPGGYKVVVMGLNQSAIPDGEVARVVLRRSAEQLDTTRFSVQQPTLALADGTKQSALGGGVDVAPDGQPSEVEESPDEEDEPVEDSDVPAEGETPDSDDALDEEETEELVDMVLGALDVSDEPQGAQITLPPGTTRVSAETLGTDTMPRADRRHASIGRGNTLTVIGKERILSDDAGNAEASLDSAESSSTPLDVDTANTVEQLDRTPVQPAEPERMARVIGTVESVGDVAGVISEQRSSRADETGVSGNRPLAVAVSLLVAAALLGGAAWQLRKRTR